MRRRARCLNRPGCGTVSDKYYGSPVASDGKIYFASESGVVAVLKAGEIRNCWRRIIWTKTFTRRRRSRTGGFTCARWHICIALARNEVSGWHRCFCARSARGIASDGGGARADHFEIGSIDRRAIDELRGKHVDEARLADIEIYQKAATWAPSRKNFSHRRMFPNGIQKHGQRISARCGHEFFLGVTQGKNRACLSIEGRRQRATLRLDKPRFCTTAHPRCGSCGAAWARQRIDGGRSSRRMRATSRLRRIVLSLLTYMAAATMRTDGRARRICSKRSNR